jgi:hypothetical protein
MHLCMLHTAYWRGSCVFRHTHCHPTGVPSSFVRHCWYTARGNATH